MPIEYEAKVLDIDPGAVAQRILDAGGSHTGDKQMRRYVFDVPGHPHRWIRLRDTGAEATLTVKDVAHDGIDGTHEVEVSVSSVEDTKDLLALLGFTPKAHQENLRSSFTLGDARLEIDTWPLIAPYLEIEADSRDQVLAAAGRLGYTEEQLTGENTTSVYARAGIDLARITDLRFPSTAAGNVPQTSR